MRANDIAITRQRDLLRLGHAEAGEPPVLIESLMHVISGWAERFRQRRALDQLDDRMLQDIGVNRFDADREAQKPFWQI